MSSPVKAPERHLVMSLNLQADSWDEMHMALRDIQHRCYEQQDRAPLTGMSIVSGGCGSGHVLEVRVNQQQTAAQYRVDLSTYLSEQRKEPTNDA